MWLAILSKMTWRDYIIVALFIVLVAGGSLFLWQRASLIKAESQIAKLSKESADKTGIIDGLNKNIKEIKAHVERVEVIRDRWHTIRQVITTSPDAPIIPPVIEPTPDEAKVCSKYITALDKQRKESENVQNIAGIITDYFNGVLPEGYNQTRGLLSETGTDKTGGPKDKPAITP